MDIFVLLLRIFIAYIFIMSGWIKTLHPGSFEKSVSNYQILPKIMVKPFSFLLSKAEIAAGIMIGLGAFTKIAALIITGFLIMFLIAFLVMVIQRRSIDCGCFGDSHSQKIGWPLILREGALILMTLCIFYYSGGDYAVDTLLKVRVF